jgi:hypothetical protein
MFPRKIAFRMINSKHLFHFSSEKLYNSQLLCWKKLGSEHINDVLGKRCVRTAITMFGVCFSVFKRAISTADVISPWMGDMLWWMVNIVDVAYFACKPTSCNLPVETGISLHWISAFPKLFQVTYWFQTKTSCISFFIGHFILASNHVSSYVTNTRICRDIYPLHIIHLFQAQNMFHKRNTSKHVRPVCVWLLCDHDSS